MNYKLTGIIFAVLFFLFMFTSCPLALCFMFSLSGALLFLRG